MDFDKLMQSYQKSTSNPPPPKRSRPTIPVRKERPRHRARRDLRVLVLVCAGPLSLHDTWVYDTEFPDKVTFGVIWYGDGDPEERLVQNVDKILRRKGPKWQLLRAGLKEMYPDFHSQFDYIWIPDDDVKFVKGQISTLATVMDEHGLELAQPCLIDKNITCAAYRPVLLQSDYPNARFHRTNFVEIMCPMLSATAMAQVLPTFDNDSCKSGWGLDSVWPSLLPEYSVGVVDVVVVEHTRPPNAFASQQPSKPEQMTTDDGDKAGLVPSSFYAKIDPRKEELELLTKYGVAPFAKRVIEIVESV